MEWLGAWACPSHRHGHFVILIQPFRLVKGHFGIITVQLEGWEGRRVRDQDRMSPFGDFRGASRGKNQPRQTPCCP